MFRNSRKGAKAPEIEGKTLVRLVHYYPEESEGNYAVVEVFRPLAALNILLIVLLSSQACAASPFAAPVDYLEIRLSVLACGQS